MHGFLRFSRNLGFSRIPSKASGVTPVNICWLGKCPICFPLMLGRVLRWFLFIWDNFYLANKKSKGRTLAFCHFRTGLVRRNVGGGWNRTKVAWKLDPNSFSNKVTQCLGLKNPFEFGAWNIFPLIWDPCSRFDFHTLKLAKIPISSKWVGGPWDDPRQHLSIGKVFKMHPFDVGNGF